MATDKRNFLRMNSDDSPLALPVGDTRSMVNCHVWPTYLKGVKGNTLINETVFTSTKSFTASCPFGTVGDDVTREATASSYESQESADDAALAKAEQDATADLVCTPAPTVTINSVEVLMDTIEINATSTNTASDIEYSIGGAFQISPVFTKPSAGDYTATARLVDVPTVLDSEPFSVSDTQQLSISSQITSGQTFDTTVSRDFASSDSISVNWQYSTEDDLGNEYGPFTGVPISILSGQTQGSLETTIAGYTLSIVSVSIIPPIPSGYID